MFFLVVQYYIRMSCYLTGAKWAVVFEESLTSVINYFLTEMEISKRESSPLTEFLQSVDFSTYPLLSSQVNSDLIVAVHNSTCILVTSCGMNIFAYTIMLLFAYSPIHHGCHKI